MIQIIVKKKAALARSGLWIARKAGSLENSQGKRWTCIPASGQLTKKL